MPQAANQKRVITAEQYQGLIVPPPVLPSQEELFDYQIETLVGKHLAQYADADPFRNRVPEKGLFLIVPSPKKLDLKGLMGNVELDGKTGVNYLDASYLTDIGEYPASASLLADIEDGRARLNTKPMISRENIKAEGRHPYNTWRGIVHVTVFPWVLKHHFMDLVGARYVESDVPCLCVCDGEPALDGDWERRASPGFGAASAGSVIVP